MVVSVRWRKAALAACVGPAVHDLGITAMKQVPFCGLLLFGFALRVPTLARESFWRDEIDAVLFASASWAELLGGFARPQHNGPAFHTALRLWTEAVGRSEFAVRYLSTLADVVSVGLLVALGRRLGGAAVGLAAGALWAVLPATLWYAREAKMYAWLAALAGLCLYLAVTGAQRRSLARGAGALALVAGGTWVHLFAALLLLPVGVLVVSTAARSARGRDLTGHRAWAVAGGLGLSAAAAAAVGRREWETFAVPPWTGHPFVPWAELLRRVLFGVTTNTPPLAGVLPTTLLLFVLLCAALALPGESPGAGLRRAAALWLFLALPLAAYYLVSLRLPLFAERYFVVLTPALTLLLARGLAAISARSLAIGAVTGAALLVIVAAAGLEQARVVTKADYRALGAYLREEGRDSDGLMVVMPYNDRAVRFYAGDLLAQVKPPPAAPGVTAHQLEAAVGSQVDRYERLWLVRAEAEQFDPGGAIASWLAGRAPHRESRTWVGIQLDLFEGSGRRTVR